MSFIFALPSFSSFLFLLLFFPSQAKTITNYSGGREDGWVVMGRGVGLF